MTLGCQLMTLEVTLSEHFSKEVWQEVGGMVPDSLSPGIVKGEPDKTSERESGDEAKESYSDDFALFSSHRNIVSLFLVRSG